MAKQIAYNMDCMEAMRDMEDKAFDLMLTDPPYGVSLNYSTYIDTQENWYSLMEQFIPEAIRISKMVIMPSCQIRKLGWFYKNYPPDWIMCWYKGSTGCAAHVGFNDWEPLLVYGKTRKQLYMHDYIAVNPNEKLGNYGHPCPKPVQWAQKLISMATEEGDKVIDPFLGSGTTRIACYNINRNFVGYEIDTDYFNAQEERFNKHTAQIRLFDPAPEPTKEQLQII